MNDKAYEINKKCNLNKIKNEDHKKDVIEYISIRKTIEKVSNGTLIGDIYALAILSNFLKSKPFDEVTQDDMMEFDKWLQKKFEDNSIALFEIRIKRFYKFISNKENYRKGKQIQKTIKYPPAVEWITTTRNDKELPLESILTEKQIKQILDACKDVREQVIIVSLIDGGLRNSELCSLKIKNVGFDKQLGYYFILPKKEKKAKKAPELKTGMRKIQLFLIPSATLYIREYLNHHKYKGNPDAPFIYSDANFTKNRNVEDTALSIIGLWFIVKRITKDAGIKDIHPHTLRHVSATFCAMKGFNEAMMRERFGWSKASTMPSYYTHIASKDTKDYIKKIMGIKDTDEDKKDISGLAPIVCWNCQESNVPTNLFCFKCGANLKPKKEDIMPTATDTGIVIQDIIKDPEFRKYFNDILASTFENYKKMKEKS